MRDLILITGISIKNNLKSKVLVLVYLAITLMIAAALALLFCILLIGPLVEEPSPDLKLMGTYLCLVMYSICFICMGINMNIFAYQSMTRGKARGNIESLLATPLSPANIWAGKSLAVFIPGMVLGEVLAVASMLVVNYIYFVPRVGFVYTHWIGLSSLLFLPLIYISLSFLSHLIGLSGKPVSGNILNQLFLPLGINLMINLITWGVLDATSWPFALANLGIVIIIVSIVWLLRFRLTTERIVLSS